MALATVVPPSLPTPPSAASSHFQGAESQGIGKTRAEPRAGLRQNHSVFQRDLNMHLSFWLVTHGTALGSKLVCQGAGHPKSTWTPFMECPALLCRVSLELGEVLIWEGPWALPQSPQEQQQWQQSYKAGHSKLTFSYTLGFQTHSLFSTEIFISQL